jgi:phosphatidate phosphatase APP1
MISEPPKWQSYKDAPIKGNWFTRWLKSRFRIVDYPFLLAYRGFGNSDAFVLQGHVFRAMALNRPRNKYSAWRNFIALVKLFLVRTVPQTKVCLHVDGEQIIVETDEKGFYEFNVKGHKLSSGWNKLKISLAEILVEGQEDVSLHTEVLILDGDFEYGCISDIDDTFLVSHITKIWKKLYVLLTKNAETRKPFKGVVNFYRLMEKGNRPKPNPFFYVSSSQWNLYDFLVNFKRLNKLPKGVLQLKELKDRWRDFIVTHYGSNHHKEEKIERILAMYPQKNFVLLGDNGQHDPQIYYNIAQKYPHRIKAIYIRAVKRSSKKKVNLLLSEIEEMSIPSLQFKHSHQAQDHAVQFGLIQAEQ